MSIDARIAFTLAPTDRLCRVVAANLLTAASMRIVGDLIATHADPDSDDASALHSDVIAACAAIDASEAL